VRLGAFDVTNDRALSCPAIRSPLLRGDALAALKAVAAESTSGRVTNHLYVSRRMIRSVPESIGNRLGRHGDAPPRPPRRRVRGDRGEHNLVTRIPICEVRRALRGKEKKKKKKEGGGKRKSVGGELVRRDRWKIEVNALFKFHDMAEQRGREGGMMRWRRQGRGGRRARIQRVYAPFSFRLTRVARMISDYSDFRSARRERSVSGKVDAATGSE